MGADIDSMHGIPYEEREEPVDNYMKKLWITRETFVESHGSQYNSRRYPQFHPQGVLNDIMNLTVTSHVFPNTSIINNNIFF